MDEGTSPAGRNEMALHEGGGGGWQVDISTAVNAAARALVANNGDDWDDLESITQRTLLEAVIPIVAAATGPIIEAWQAATAANALAYDAQYETLWDDAQGEDPR